MVHSVLALFDGSSSRGDAAALVTRHLGATSLLADARHRPRREAFVNDLLSVVAVETYDVDVARAHASLIAHVRASGRPRGAHDLIIAATALARDRHVLTLDLAGFRDLPDLTVRNPPT